MLEIMYIFLKSKQFMMNKSWVLPVLSHWLQFKQNIDFLAKHRLITKGSYELISGGLGQWPKHLKPDKEKLLPSNLHQQYFLEIPRIMQKFIAEYLFQGQNRKVNPKEENLTASGQNHLVLYNGNMETSL